MTDGFIGKKFYKPLDDELEKQYAEAAEWCNSTQKGYIVESEDGSYYEVIAIPEPTIEDIRENKLLELKGAFENARTISHLVSSVGFEINATDEALDNIEGLLLTTDDSQTVSFCDYKNDFHDVGKSDLEVMRKEIAEYSQSLRKKKWAYRDAINSAATKEELDAIVIDFGVV